MSIFGLSRNIARLFVSVVAEIELIGSTVGTSSVTGSLLVATELIGSTVGTSSVTGSLLVATSLAGSTVGTSSVTGSLLVTTELIGSAAGTSSVIGSLLVPTELIGSTVGTSSVTGSLSVVEFSDSAIKLLCHFNGDDEAISTVDFSGYGHPITFVGTAQLDTAEKKFGSASLLLDGNDSSLTIIDSPNWDICANVLDDWIIDFFVKHTDHIGTEYYITQGEGVLNRDNCWEFGHIGGIGIFFRLISDEVVILTLGGVGEIIDTNLHHVALCKVGNKYGLYLDGIQKSYTLNNSTDTFIGILNIGAQNIAAGYFDGHIDEIRIVHQNVFNAAPNAELTDTITPPTEEHDDSISFLILGSAAGTSGVIGSLKVIKLQGSAVGTSGVTGSLLVATELISSAAGISSVTGFLDSQPECIGSAVGTSGVIGSLLVATELIGSAAGTSGVTGSLRVATSLVGFADGTSDIIGRIFSADELIGSTDGISGVTGYLRVVTELIGSTSGTSGVTGSLSFVEINIIGSTAGISGVTGSLLIATSLAGSTDGISSITGSLLVTTSLSGFVVGTSGVTGSLSFVEINIIGSTAGISGVTGSLLIATSLAGSTDGISSITGSLLVAIELIGSTVGTLGVTGSLSFLIIELIGSTAGISGVIGSLSFIIIELIGSTSGTSGVTGSLLVAIELIGLTAEFLSVESYLGIVPDFNASTLFWRPQNDIVETLEWKTSILKANDGTEQRIKVRQSPRQHFKLEIIFPTNKLNTWYDSIIHTWQKLTWLIPVWPEYVEHFEDINSHDTVITVDTTNADFRDNNKAIVWKSSTEYEILVIDSKTNSQLNLSYSMLSSFTGDKYIMPVRTAYLISSSKKEKYNSEVSVVTLIFAVYDNIDQLEDYAVANYDGYEILDVPSFMDNSHLESSDGDIFIADFKTGIFKVESDSIYNFLSQNHSFFNDTKKACWDFRKFLYSLDGRQKVVLIPTFRSDVVQTDNIAALDTSVKIENIGLAENMGFNSLRTYIGFYFPATGILTIRKITAITELDSSEEQIDFDVNLGSLIESGDCKIGFVDKCRLASDKVEIRWPQAHKNECRTNFMRVP